MKIVISILGTLVLVFVIVQLFALKTQKDIETYPYVVVKKYDQFEIRNYESRLFTSVKLPTNRYENASSKGFSILAGYIFGNNKTNEKDLHYRKTMNNYENINNNRKQEKCKGEKQGNQCRRTRAIALWR